MNLTVFKSSILEPNVIYVNQMYTSTRLMDIHIHGKLKFPSILYSAMYVEHSVFYVTKHHSQSSFPGQNRMSSSTIH